MPVADHATYCRMLEHARTHKFAYPAINITSSSTINAALVHAFPGDRVGTVTVEVDRHGDDGAQLVVRDDGVGMEPAVLRRVFDPFFTTQRGRGGSGLGMHIVHNLVTDLLGGTIEVSSTPNLGTRVTIRLPIRVEPKR